MPFFAVYRTSLCKSMQERGRLRWISQCNRKDSSGPSNNSHSAQDPVKLPLEKDPYISRQVLEQTSANKAEELKVFIRRTNNAKQGVSRKVVRSRRNILRYLNSSTHPPLRITNCEINDEDNFDSSTKFLALRQIFHPLIFYFMSCIRQCYHAIGETTDNLIYQCTFDFYLCLCAFYDQP